MSRITKRGPRSPEMNMTPMIDITFQLIIFFMLVNNIIAEETVQLIVPALENPQTQEMREGNKVTVNIAPRDYQSDDRKDNPLLWDGAAQYVNVGGRRIEMGNLAEGTEFLKAEFEKTKAGGGELEVILRADAALFYEEVQPVMNMITNAGIAKVNLMAYLPEDGSKPEK